jgi:hypothetical protein
VTDTRTRNVIVALPDGTAADWLRVSQILAWHGHPACIPLTAFPVRHHRLLGLITRWSTRHLMDPARHHGSVTRAAGGRLSRLDLARLVIQARNDAAARWQTWNAFVARTTPTARPWETFATDSQKDPDAQRDDKARRTFETQPRVLSMLAYNSYPAAPHHLDPDELTAYQAGEAVYVALHWQQAITGDALVTPDGQFLEPQSPSLADRLRYLADATRVIYGLNPHQHLVSVQAAPAP